MPRFKIIILDILLLEELTKQLISLENANVMFMRGIRSQPINNIIIDAINLIALLKKYEKTFKKLISENIEMDTVEQAINIIIITIRNIIDQSNRGVNESNIFEICQAIISLTHNDIYNVKIIVAGVLETLQSSQPPPPPPPPRPPPPPPSSPLSLSHRSLSPRSLSPPLLLHNFLDPDRSPAHPSRVQSPQHSPVSSSTSSSDHEDVGFGFGFGFGLKYRKKRSNKRANYMKRRGTRSLKMKKKARKTRLL